MPASTASRLSKVDGNTHEKVYAVGWSHPDTRIMGDDGKVKAVENNVDLAKGTWDNRTGAPELTTWW